MMDVFIGMGRKVLASLLAGALLMPSSASAAGVAAVRVNVRAPHATGVSGAAIGSMSGPARSVAVPLSKTSLSGQGSSAPSSVLPAAAQPEVVVSPVAGLEQGALGQAFAPAGLDAAPAGDGKDLDPAGPAAPKQTSSLDHIRQEARHLLDVPVQPWTQAESRAKDSSQVAAASAKLGRVFDGSLELKGLASPAPVEGEPDGSRRSAGLSKPADTDDPDAARAEEVARPGADEPILPKDSPSLWDKAASGLGSLRDKGRVLWFGLVSRVRRVDTSELSDREAARRAREILASFTVENRWSKVLRESTSRDEAQKVFQLSREVTWSGGGADRFFVAFYEEAAAALKGQPERIRRLHERTPVDWHQQAPLYYSYPNGVKFPDTPGKGGTLHDIARLTGYLKEEGYGSLYLLPMFDSPDGDAGFDIRSWSIKKSLGGEKAMDRLMDASAENEIPVIVDLPLNHLSWEHEWFQKLRAGDLKMADRFLRVPVDREKVGERVIDGKTYAIYRDPDGTETPRWIIFPHASRHHHIDLDVKGKKVRLYHTFYPFQPDVNLRNPFVFQHNLRLLSGLINRGVLGLRLDAIHHWLKRDGTDAEGLPETLSYARILNLFAKMVGPKTRIFPEVGADTEASVRYLGVSEKLARAGAVPSVSDAIWGLDIRAAIPEAVLLRRSEPFWRAVERIPNDMPRQATIVAMITHHDELRGDFLNDPKASLTIMLSKGGVPFRDGSGVSGRFAPMVENNQRRIALAQWLMFMFPKSTPSTYYGEEAALGNDAAFADAQQVRRKGILERMGLKNLDREHTFDSRDVQRQTVDFAALEGARRKGALSILNLRKLASLRKDKKALRGHAMPIRLEDKDDRVVVMARQPEEWDLEKPVLAAANLSEETVEVRIPLQRFQDAMALRKDQGVYLSTLHSTDPAGKLDWRVDGRNVVLKLPPETFFLSEAYELSDIPLAAIPSEPAKSR